MSKSDIDTPSFREVTANTPLFDVRRIRTQAGYSAIIIVDKKSRREIIIDTDKYGSGYEEVARQLSVSLGSVVADICVLKPRENSSESFFKKK